MNYPESLITNNKNPNSTSNDMEKEKQSRSVEETYKKMNPREHILLRPDTYIGSIEQSDADLWVLSDDATRFEFRKVVYVPGLYKIFDEILVNAADNYQRDNTMNMLQVAIDEESQTISVWNNGQSIPIEVHKEYKMHIPELIFGHLLTGSNYDDDEKKVVGGRNGYGAKLTNIFSKTFTINCACDKTKRSFEMTWTDNMLKHTKPKIQENYNKKAYTCVTWQSDLQRFGLKEYTKDMIALLKKRVYDLAGIFAKKVKVYLNGTVIDIKSFKDYVDMYFPPNSTQLKVGEKQIRNGSRWEVMVSFSDGVFQQVSFVNAICTSKGGTHVNYVADLLVKEIKDAIEKKHKKLEIKPHQIRQHLWIFVNCLIENPAFDSQTKETLTSKSQSFGSKPEISEKFIQDILKSGIIDMIIAQAHARENAQLTKQLKGSKKARLIGIPKLEDANDAGTSKSKQCTLILTEGDSAKALAMAGIEVVGRNTYGCFPLKGKLLNVRDTNPKSILENEEIQNLIKIVGLQVGKKYQNLNDLRYGSIMIMADQDTDGSHIKGLILNFVENFWPELFQMHGFLKEFVTPIIKVSRKTGKEVITFFTISDFKTWASQRQDLKNWNIKYYKGLGTSDNKEAAEYFQNLQRHQIAFLYQDVKDSQAIDLLFNKNRADDRKEWLTTFNPDINVDHNNKVLKYTEFVDKEFIHHAVYDNMRSIPSVVDGMKPSQRKILFACFKRKLRSEIKVAQLSGYVAEHSAYHHGEMSLVETIIGMAQNYVGSNNINLLQPLGQFGTRNMGGKDHASGRYIFTMLSKITRTIFPESDDHILQYLEEDNQKIEPWWYIPIIPMVLVNGAEGIGTGWSTSIPCYDPRDIVANIIHRLNGRPFQEMVPWYKGFQGEISLSHQKMSKASGSEVSVYTMQGIYEMNKDKEDTFDITELPIGRWTRDYKTILEKMLEKGTIEDFKEFHTQNRVHFQIKATPEKIEEWEDAEQTAKVFGLKSQIQTSNFVLFDQKCVIKRYANTCEIMEEFYQVRLTHYNLRKQYLISALERECQILENQVRFISMIVEGSLIIQKKKKKVIVDELTKLEFVPFSKLIQIKSNKEDIESPKDVIDGEVDNDPITSDFDYLLQMRLWSLTEEQIEKLKNSLEQKQKELERLRVKKESQMWIDDLKQFVIALEQVEEEEEKQRLLVLKKSESIRKA